MTQTPDVGAPEGVRERLLEAALRLFNERGYAATTVREIVEAAGVTKPVLYYHFENKEGIYLHLMTRGFAEVQGTIEAALASEGTAVERLHSLFDSTYRLFLDHTAEVRLMHAIFYGPPQGAPFFDYDQYHTMFETSVRQLMLDGMAAGEFTVADPDEMAMVVLGVLNVSMEVYLCHPDRRVSPEGLIRMLDLALAGLTKRP